MVSAMPWELFFMMLPDVVSFGIISKGNTKANPVWPDSIGWQ
jgi:hypothetical protein